MKTPGAFAVRLTLAAGSLSLVVTGFFGCKREQPADQPVQPAPNAWGQPGYGQPTAQPTYGQPNAQPTAQPTATAPQSPSQPAPYAPLCSLPEGTCGWAKCNLSVGRCMWPCGSDADCITGARCMGPPGFAQCVGGLGGQAR